MARGISPKHLQTLTLLWRDRIRTLYLHGAKRGAQYQQLCSMLKLDPASLATAEKKRLMAALDELRVAGGSDAAAVCKGDCGPGVDEWIMRRMIRRGPECLVRQAQHQAALASVRDEDRRRSHRRGGLRVSSVEMSADHWAKLKRIQDEMEQPSAGQTIAALIDLHARVKKPSGKRPALPKTKKAADEMDSRFPDLFSAAPPRDRGYGGR